MLPLKLFSGWIQIHSVFERWYIAYYVQWYEYQMLPNHGEKSWT